MAVEDTTSSDTSTADAVDTSVNSDDSSVSDEDVNLEDIEVDLTDIEDTDVDTEAESDDSGEETDTEESTADEPSEDDADSQEEAEPELSDEDKQKALNNEMAQRRIQEREARIARVKQDQAEYIAEAGENRDPLELAVRQLQVSEYNNTVDAVQNKLTNGYERALVDFPVLKTADPVIQAEIDAAIDAFQSQYVTIDDYGNATSVRGDLYATLQAKAHSIEKLTGIRVKQQEQSKTKEKSKTLATPTRAPKQPKVDPDLAAFDEEAYK